MGGILVLALYGVRHHYAAQFPYGERRAAMLIMYYALLNYANDHAGSFPADENAYVALTKLYPHYCPTGAELAGLSVDETKTKERLLTGKPLDGSTTSWIYLPGLKSGDDPRIALLWESQEGLRHSGRVSDNQSHAVLLVDGTITNIPGDIWAQFREEQRRLLGHAAGK
ncbi:MAG TPA: hypothetical protein VL527_12210 [Dongiaceae bacterium]|nr:hypothetical protein [Dongiaceae bacterium]